MTTAIDNATQVNDIGFAEFTSTLVNEVFDALVSSNIRQMDAYNEMLASTQKELSEYINETQDSIPPSMLMDFLNAALPNSNLDMSGDTVSLTSDKVTSLNKSLAISEIEEPHNAVAADGMQKSALLDAVAKRVAANKYDILQQMVKQGVLRLIVEHGEIETRMTFSTWDYSSSVSRESEYSRETHQSSTRASTGWLTSMFASAGGRSRSNSLKVSTASKTDKDYSGSRVNIFGGVKIQFRTDYVPLDK